jgi:hypothetical protein
MTVHMNNAFHTHPTQQGDTQELPEDGNNRNNHPNETPHKLNTKLSPGKETEGQIEAFSPTRVFLMHPA